MPNNLLILPPVVMRRSIIDGALHIEAETNAVDPEILRYAALYWDGVGVPFPLGPSEEAEGDFDALEEVGVLRQLMPPPRVVNPILTGPRGSTVLRHIQFGEHQSRMLDRHYPGGSELFPIHQISDFLGGALMGCFEALESDPTLHPGHYGPTQPHETGDVRALEVELYRSIPVPLGAPIKDILEFREVAANKAALQTLRGYLSELHADVLAAPDRPIAQIDATTELKRVILTLDLAMMDRGWMVKAADLVSQVRLPAEIATGIGASALFGGVLDWDLVETGLSSRAAANAVGKTLGGISTRLAEKALPAPQRSHPAGSYYLKTRALSQGSASSK